METLSIVVGTLATAAVLKLSILWLLSGRQASVVRFATGIFFRMIRDEAFRGQIQLLIKPTPAKKERPSGVPLRLFALLQKQGRLLDFLLEDIQAYPDAQIGAAVRDIHRQCQGALREHLVLTPVLNQREGEAVEVGAGFDPSAIRVIGNVTGAPPYRGTLQHHGWRVQELKLAAPPEGQDELVLQPAEVEIQ